MPITNVVVTNDTTFNNSTPLHQYIHIKHQPRISQQNTFIAADIIFFRYLFLFTFRFCLNTT